MTTSPGAVPVHAAQPSTPLRHNRQFRLLWIGALGSMLGMEAASVAYPLVILAVTGSLAATGLFGLVWMLTITAGALPAGEVVDRFDHRTVLLCSEGGRMGGAVVSIAVAVHAGNLSVGHVVVAAAVVGMAQTFGGQLGAALASEELRTGAAQLAGPALGGFLYGLRPVLPFVATRGRLPVARECDTGRRVGPDPGRCAEPTDRCRRAGSAGRKPPTAPADRHRP